MSSRAHRIVASIALSWALAAPLACGAAPGTRPDDMSAAEHRAAAEQSERSARAHQEQVASADYEQGDRRGAGSAYSPGAHIRQAAEDRKHAEEHRQAAKELERFEKEECKGVPPESRVECPLLGAIVDASDTATGVLLRLSPQVHPLAVVDHIRCHVAFGRTHGRHGMDRCPLYVEGVRVEVGEQERTIELAVEDPAQLDELRKRVHDYAGW